MKQQGCQASFLSTFLMLSVMTYDITWVNALKLSLPVANMCGYNQVTCDIIEG